MAFILALVYFLISIFVCVLLGSIVVWCYLYYKEVAKENKIYNNKKNEEKV